MSGIEDQGLRPDKVEPAPADESGDQGKGSAEESTPPVETDVPTPEESTAEEPTTEDLQEPSTEKVPGEEPKAPDRREPEPSHEAVGIGIIGRPQTEMEEEDE